VPSLGEVDGERLPDTEGVPALGDELGLLLTLKEGEVLGDPSDGVAALGEALGESDGDPSSGDTDGLVSVSFSQWMGTDGVASR
jgi:hypothetical protein